MNADLIQTKHAAGLEWPDYLASMTDDQRAAWQKVYDQIQLTDKQKQVLGSYVREMQVVALSGAWCGDCVRQGPMFQKIAEASNGKIKLKWCDRDEHMDLQEQVMVCGGKRVPVVVFAACPPSSRRRSSVSTSISVAMCSSPDRSCPLRQRSPILTMKPRRQ